MSDVKISIEIRIEAGTEGEARKYAAAHGIDTTCAHWQRNSSSKGGRLYVADSTPLRSAQFSKNGAGAVTPVKGECG